MTGVAAARIFGASAIWDEASATLGEVSGHAANLSDERSEEFLPHSEQACRDALPNLVERVRTS